MKRLLALILFVTSAISAQTFRPTNIAVGRFGPLTTAQEAGFSFVDGDWWYNTDLQCFRRKAGGVIACVGTGAAEMGYVTVGAVGGTVTPSATAVALAQESTTGGAIADGTYYCVSTLVNLNGESTPSPEGTIVISAGTGTAQLRAVLAGREWSTGAFGFKVYCGTVSGGPYFLQTPRTWTTTMDNNTVSRDANDFVTLTKTGLTSLGLGVGYDITVAGAAGCTDQPNGNFKVYSHTATAASSSVTFKHAGATESGCGGAAITVTWTAPGVFSAENTGAATHLVGAHLVRGNTILTSIAGSGANPPSTNTAAIDDVQVAINAARVASSLAAGQIAKVEKTVQLAEGNDQISGGKFFYGITTPLIITVSDRLVGNATTVLDSINTTGTMIWARSSGSGAGVNALWDDVYDRIGAVMIMNSSGTLLKDVNIDADGPHAVMIYQSEGDAESSNNIRLLNGTWRTTGTNCTAPLRTMARIYYLTVDGVNLTPSTSTDCFASTGTPRGAALMMSHGAGSEWVFKGPVRWTVPAKHDFIQNRMGPTDPDRGVNRSGFSQRNHLVLQNMGHFQATAGGGTGIICRCENTILNSVSSPGPADYNVSAGTDAAYIFGANSYGAGGAQTFYKASLLSTANNAATVKFMNSGDRLELLNSTIGGSSTLVDFNNFSVPVFALFSGPSDFCDPRASYFANRVTTPGSGSNHFLCLGSLASNTADRREGPHLSIMGGILEQGWLATPANARYWCIIRENASFRDCYYKDPDTTAQRISSTSLTTGVTQFYGADGSTVILEVDKANDRIETPNINGIIFVDKVKYTTIEAALTAAEATGIGRVVVPPGYTETITAPLTVGSATAQVVLEIHKTATITVNVTSGTDAIQLYSKSSIVSEGSNDITDQVVLASTANVSSVIASYPRTGAQSIINIRGITIKGHASATVTRAMIDLVAVTDESNLNFVLYNFAGYGVRLENGDGLSVGPVNFNNITVNGSAVATAKPFYINAANTNAVMGPINFFGGSLTHPGTGGLAIAKIDGGANNQITSVNFFGTQFESSNAADIGIDIEEATGIHGAGLVFTAAAAAGADCIKISNGSGVAYNITFDNITNYNSWTNTINDTARSVTITDARVSQFTVLPPSDSAAYILSPDATIRPITAKADYNVRRLKVGQGTALVAGDFALSAGCGSTASVSAVASNSRDQTFEFDLASAGTGQGANTCTATLTFKDGTFTTAPFLTCQRNDTLATAGRIAQTTLSATAPVLTFVGTPVAAETYKIACNFVGN